jgi:hypothetical protein
MASMLLAGGLALAQVVNTILAFPASAAIKESTSDDVFDEVEVILYGLGAFVLIPIGIASYVVTCLWLGKCRKNADLFAPDYKQDRDSVWVWLGWLIPIVSLWFPYQVVRDVRRASIQLRAESATIVWWWVAWLVWLVGSRIAGNLFPDDLDKSGANGLAQAIPVVETINGVAILVALVLWIRLVREITHGQVQLVHRDVSAINRW